MHVCLPHVVREEHAHRVASAQRSEGSQGSGPVHIWGKSLSTENSTKVLR